ncbi:MAG: hypothetical protein MJ070_00395 [Lachnospiraceae bacterium]|nr:hypothetical protein [Lachnospiraceae bacterium]
MFSNIGHKIKNLAILFAVLGIIASILLGVYLLENEYSAGGPVLILGPLSAWIGSFVLYGFGELIETVTDIDQKLRELSSAKNDPDAGIKKLREQGLITEEEYLTAISKK